MIKRGELYDILTQYKKIHCMAISKLKKKDLIKLAKDLGLLNKQQEYTLPETIEIPEAHKKIKKFNLSQFNKLKEQNKNYEFRLKALEKKYKKAKSENQKTIIKMQYQKLKSKYNQNIKMIDKMKKLRNKLK